MDQALRLLVRRRAGDACEYCRLPQSASPYVRFHVEHIVARQHGGADVDDNLALACSFCNYHKGPNIAGVDPESGRLVRLFHPRHDRWDEHFAWQGVALVGRSEVSRATIVVLRINHRQRIELRRDLRARGESFVG